MEVNDVNKDNALNWIEFQETIKDLWPSPDCVPNTSSIDLPAIFQDIACSCTGYVPNAAFVCCPPSPLNPTIALTDVYDIAYGTTVCTEMITLANTICGLNTLLPEATTVPVVPSPSIVTTPAPTIASVKVPPASTFPTTLEPTTGSVKITPVTESPTSAPVQDLITVAPTISTNRPTSSPVQDIVENPPATAAAPVPSARTSEPSSQTKENEIDFANKDEPSQKQDTAQKVLWPLFFVALLVCLTFGFALYRRKRFLSSNARGTHFSWNGDEEDDEGDDLEKQKHARKMARVLAESTESETNVELLVQEADAWQSKMESQKNNGLPYIENIQCVPESPTQDAFLEFNLPTDWKNNISMVALACSTEIHSPEQTPERSSRSSLLKRIDSLEDTIKDENSPTSKFLRDRPSVSPRMQTSSPVNVFDDASSTDSMDDRRSIASNNSTSQAIEYVLKDNIGNGSDDDDHAVSSDDASTDDSEDQSAVFVPVKTSPARSSGNKTSLNATDFKTFVLENKDRFPNQRLHPPPPMDGENDAVEAGSDVSDEKSLEEAVKVIHKLGGFFPE